MKSNRTSLLLTLLLPPLLIWLAEMLILLRKKIHFLILAVFQDPAQPVHIIKLYIASSLACFL